MTLQAAVAYLTHNSGGSRAWHWHQCSFVGTWCEWQQTRSRVQGRAHVVRQEHVYLLWSLLSYKTIRIHSYKVIKSLRPTNFT